RRVAQEGRPGRPSASLVLAHEVPPPAVPDRIPGGSARAVPAAVRVRRRQRIVLPPVLWPAPDLPPPDAAAAGADLRPAAAAAVHQRVHPVRPVPVHGGPGSPQLR